MIRRIAEYVTADRALAKAALADLADGRYAEAEAFDDGWKQLVESGFHEVMAELAGSSPSVPELATALLARGWVDCTERQDPER